MRRLLHGRRGVETVIGGLVVLVLFVFSLIAMVALSQQYDLYLGRAAAMQRMDTDRLSENLQGVYPGIWPEPRVGPTSCGGGWCNAYNMTLANLGIGVQIARIYVNSSESPGCTTPCVLTPSPTPAPNTFQASQRYINPGEFFHSIFFWLPWNPTSQKTTLPLECLVKGALINYDCNTITIVTTRGRIFSFQWPFPPAGSQGAGGAGGTGVYIGPVVYTYQRQLVSYTTHSSCNPTCIPQIPIGGTPNGYWILPADTLMIYVKLQTDAGVQKDVYLTAQAVLELVRMEQQGGPGNVLSLTIQAPITPALCAEFSARDPTIICDSNYGYYAGGNTGDPDTHIDYQPCVASPANYKTANCPTPRYLIPAPTQAQLEANQRGNPIVVAFYGTVLSSWRATSVTSFLGLTYVYDDGSGVGAYVFGVTLPFIGLCVNDGSNKCPG
jgi:hypothetical protein